MNFYNYLNNQENINKLSEEILFKFTKNNITSGIVVALFHYFGFLLIAYKVIFGEIDYLYYYYVFLWIIVVIGNVIFKGCILMRIERYLLNNKDWFGMWELLFYPLNKLGIEISRDNKKNIFIFTAHIISLFIILRLFVFKKDHNDQICKIVPSSIISDEKTQL